MGQHTSGARVPPRASWRSDFVEYGGFTLFKIVGGDGATNKPPEEIVLPSGVVVAKWSKGGIQFAKDLPFNQKAFEKVVIQFFEQDLTQ